MNYKLLIIIALFLVGCEKTDEEKASYLQINNVELTDIGRIAEKYSFDAYLMNDSICQVRIKTIRIGKGDSIESIEAYTKGDILNFKITSTPYSLWGCGSDSCFTVHDLHFETKGLKADDYYIHLNINNVVGEIFKYNIHNAYYGK